MNRIIFITIVFLTCLHQVVDAQDRIFLQNGDKLKGHYLPALSTDTTLFLAIFDRGVHIPYSIIRFAKFGKGSGKRKEFRELKDIFYEPIESGYYYRFGLGTLVGNHSYWEDPSFTFTTNAVIGFRWNNFKNIGIKTGYDDYGDYGSVPLAIHYEFDLRKRQAPPVIMAGMGYGFVWGREDAGISFDRVNGGIHYYVNLGWRFKTDNGTFITLRTGGQAQHTVQRMDNPDLPELYYSVVYQKRRMRRFTLAIDFTF